VDVDPSGVLYVADTGNDRVEAYAPDGTLRWSQGVRSAQKALGNFDNPRDVAYLNGRLYVADLGNKRVQVLDAATGAPIEAWAVTLPSPIGITAGVDGSGNAVVLVAQDTEDQIAEYTPDGALVRTIGAPGGGSGDGQLAAPRDAATDAAGNIYVADYANDRVAKFTPGGAWITSWGSSGGLDGQFRRPYGVALDVQGRVYVADSTNHRVQIFDGNGTFLAKYGTAGTGPGQLSMLRRVAIAPGVANPDIYLADLWGYKVDRISQDGSFGFTYRQTFAGTPPLDGMFNEPSGVSVDASHVYVADSVNQRMQRFDTATGALQLTWGERGWGGDLLGFNWPRDLTLNPVLNTVWVADTKNGRLLEFDPDGNPTGRAFGTQGSGIGQFNRPFGIVSYGSSVIVVDSANNRVQRWDVSAPTPTLVWSTSGPSNPQALVVDGGTVLVTDTRNNRLVRLDVATGAQVGSPLGVGSLHSPEGVAVDANGNIWVGDRAANRLVELAADGSFLQAYGAFGSAHGQFNYPTHLAIFGGLLYVCDVWNDRIEVYDLHTQAPLPTVSVGDVSVAEGNSGTTPAVFRVTLSAPSAQTVAVGYATADGTATAPSDYTAASGTLTFAPGETAKTVSVSVNGDTTLEPDETFALNLSNPVNATVADGQGIGTILNDDQAPGLSIQDASVVEGNAGTAQAVFRVTLSAPAAQAVGVHYATANGTAVAPGDYAAASGTVTFAPGDMSKTVTVLVNGDTLSEADETFTLGLSNATNASIVRAQAVGTIVNDDPPPSLAIGDTSVLEGRPGSHNVATFRVTLSAPSGQTVTVAYATADGTASSSSDYSATSGTLTFSPGQTTLTIGVSIRGDWWREPNETFFVRLSNASHATISRSQGVGTILNDD
jgi:DNA-binding beta-propeller fold protein YncE